MTWPGSSIAYAESRLKAEKRRDEFVRWCREQGYERAANGLVRDWERMVTFYRFPREHWKHIRTTNVVESPFAALRLRTDAAKRYRKVGNATAVIWKMLLLAEKSFRRLDAPEKMKLVYKLVYMGIREHENAEAKQEKVLAIA